VEELEVGATSGAIDCRCSSKSEKGGAIDMDCDTCVLEGIWEGSSLSFSTGKGNCTIREFLGPHFTNLHEFQIDRPHVIHHFDQSRRKSQFNSSLSFSDLAPLVSSVLTNPNRIFKIHDKKAIFLGIFDFQLGKPRFNFDSPSFGLFVSVLAGSSFSHGGKIATVYPIKSLTKL
jgi:hypothetical protein